MPSFSKRIRDPLHGLIPFNSDLDKVCWDIIQTAPFQRLRRVKQLGFSEFTYPGACHSRLAHSVGVFHTARRLADRLHEIIPSVRHDNESRCAAIAAALVHDLGHGPFSHAFEEALEASGFHWSHENMSEALIRDTVVGEILDGLMPNHREKVIDIVGSQNPKNLYYSIVSSQFDADRLDYMQRDRLMSGRLGSAIDFPWLLANLDMRRVPVYQDEELQGEVETFVIGEKSILAAEAYVLGLFQLYQTVYLHKTTRGLEKIFSEILKRLFFLRNESAFDKTGLNKNHAIFQFLEDSSNPEKFLKLDDTLIWGALHELCDAKDSVLSELARRLLERQIYKAIDLTALVQSKVKPEKVRSKEVEVISKISENFSSAVNQSPRILHDVAKRNPYKRLSASGDSLKKILAVDRDGNLRDLADLSSVVSALKPFHSRRVYCRDESEKKKVTEFILGELK
jgi:HD superfamily phosphohydrolase